MKVPVFTHPACLQHDPGPEHPETPARLRVLLERLRQEPQLDVREAASAAIDDVVMVHPRAYLASIEELSRRGGGPIFLDTVLNQHSWQAALGATGAALAALRHGLET
ncbi:MAG: histone deacetylase family protein, partial [Gemmatimonadales bacterium]